MDLGIQGNTALVTASSSGLGKHAAKALSENGAHVVINGRTRETLATAAAEIRSVASGDVVTVQGDLTDEGDISRLVERTVDEFGTIDHLVTNAGGPPSGPFLETADDEWYHAFELLVMSVVRVIRESTEFLQQGDGGTIVNITSRSVKEAIDSLVLSNSVRMSVIGLEKTLSKELAPDVRANAVLPGPIETERHKNLLHAAIDRGEYDSYEEGLAHESQQIPVGRIGRPAELGDLVAYLSSKRSSFVNGTAITIDGGGSKSNL